MEGRLLGFTNGTDKPIRIVLVGKIGRQIRRGRRLFAPCFFFYDVDHIKDSRCRRITR